MIKTKANTPVMLQMEASECGAASLGIVLGYYGAYYPLEQLRQICNVTRNGSDAANILLGAEILGLKGAGYQYLPEEIVKLEPPCIIHWGFNHFLVYEGYDEKKQRVWLNDPAEGHVQVSWQEFEENYTGIVLVLRPGEEFTPGGERSNVWRKLAATLLEYKKALAFVLSLGLCLAIVNLYTPVLSQVFFDDVLNYRHRSWLFEVLLGMGMVFVLQLILGFFRSWCLLRWQGSMAMDGAAGILEHVLHLPIDFFQQRFAGEIVSRLQLAEQVATFVTGDFAVCVLDFLIAIFYLVLLFIYAPGLTAIGVFFTFISIAVTWFTISWLREQQMKLQQEAGRMYGIAVTGIASMETLKANGTEKDFFVKWANYNARYLDMGQQMEYYSQFIGFLPMLLGSLSSSLVMLVGGFNIMDGLMTVGIFVAFQNLMSNFQAPVNRLMGMTQAIQQTESQLMKIEDVLCYPEEEHKALQDTPPKRLRGKVELKNVSFAYGRVGKPLVKRLNLCVEPGRRLAIVGKSGCGKSTVAKLVCGICTPWFGEVLFDDIPLAELDRRILAGSLAVVEQEIVLFQGTIADNIALFDPTISRLDIINAAKDAMLHEEISLLSGGYDALVEEDGANFSGGQRQRLELARALAVNPSILVLDEATAELDPVTENKIMENVRRRGCTCIIIAHRLSTIRDCDEIIMLENGRVVERGTHKSLLEKDGKYKALVAEK